jgi:hypothetical protein
MNILISGTINRPDILKMFDLLKDQTLTFVEYPACFDERTPEVYAPYGTVFSWRDFRSADELLDKTQPDRVVLLFNSSFNQVALRLAAKRRAIPVIHLEHGFRLRADADSQKELDAVAKRQRSTQRFLNPKELLENNAFLTGTLLTLRGEERDNLLEYLELTYFEVPDTHSLRASAQIRKCDAYVTYSKEIFEYARELDNIGSDVPVHFTGIPQFDDFRAEVSYVIPKSVLLIDHQFVNGGYFGWNVEFRKSWAQMLVSCVEKSGRQLFIKTHPGDRSSVWKPYLDAKRVKTVTHEELVTQGFETVVGVLSTLMLPFAAQKHTTILGLEIHPHSGHFVSEPLAHWGILAPSFDWAQFEGSLTDPNPIHDQQVPRKSEFTRAFLCTLDGGAKKRLTDALLAPFDVS